MVGGEGGGKIPSVVSLKYLFLWRKGLLIVQSVPALGTVIGRKPERA